MFCEGSLPQINSYRLTFFSASARRVLRSLTFPLLYFIVQDLTLYFIKSHRTRLSVTSLNSSSHSEYFKEISSIWEESSNKLELNSQSDGPCELGYPKNSFGLHSLRTGGASAAANAGVSDRLFKRHGRWKTDQAKDGYIKDKLDSLLSVSRSLHI